MSDLVELVAGGHGPTLETVIGVWQRVLQRSSIQPTDDFFDLGGDSLLAIQLFAELERVTGRSLPITTIYDASTAAGLASLLDQSAEPAGFSPLVLLNDPGPGHRAGQVASIEQDTASVFLIHGIGGHVMELTRLGKTIDPTRPVFAIQARGLDGIEPAIDSIDVMADYYLEAIRQKQPAGPYILIGYSFGGIVALEMARRIEAAGQRVALLGFIDSYPHPTHWPLVSWLDVRWRRMAHRANTRLRTQAADLANWYAGRQREQRRAGASVTARPFKFDDDWPESVRHVYDTSLGALARYTPSAYPGSVVFFRAASRSFYLPNSPRRMWGKLLGKLDVVTVPGDHMDMVGPNAAALGAEIASRIRSASTGPRSQARP